MTVTWKRCDEPGRGVRAYHYARWRLDAYVSPDIVDSWQWNVREMSRGEWVLREWGESRKLRRAKAMAALALEMLLAEDA